MANNKSEKREVNELYKVKEAHRLYHIYYHRNAGVQSWIVAAINDGSSQTTTTETHFTWSAFLSFLLLLLFSFVSASKCCEKFVFFFSLFWISNPSCWVILVLFTNAINRLNNFKEHQEWISWKKTLVLFVFFFWKTNLAGLLYMTLTPVEVEFGAFLFIVILLLWPNNWLPSDL